MIGAKELVYAAEICLIYSPCESTSEKIISFHCWAVDKECFIIFLDIFFAGAAISAFLEYIANRGMV